MTPTPCAPPAASASRRRFRVLWLSIAGPLWCSCLWAALPRGVVQSRSEAQFLEHVRDTQAAGEDTVRFLGSDPDSVILEESRAGAHPAWTTSVSTGAT